MAAITGNAPYARADGYSTVHSIDLSGHRPELPDRCGVRYGAELTLAVQFTPTRNARELRAEVTLTDTLGHTAPVPHGVPPDPAAAGVSCPMTAGKRYTYRGLVRTLPANYPRLMSSIRMFREPLHQDLTWTLTDDSGAIAVRVLVPMTFEP
ncbi:ML domain-containing protein [Nocardia aurea]|jgi:hypothetical protein|uniref:ML domain-containing protein n=1 Tax=Nocardia aurea TaxID=2144174 RepID=A0ABV3FT89_9NOCA